MGIVARPPWAQDTSSLPAEGAILDGSEYARSRGVEIVIPSLLLGLASAAIGLLVVLALVGALRIRRWRRLAAQARRLCREGRLEEAGKVASSLLQTVLGILPRNDPMLAEFIQTQALIAHASGRLVEAEDQYKQALKLLEDPDDGHAFERTVALQLLALNLRSQGRLLEAEGTAELALSAAEEKLEPTDTRLAEFAYTLALAYLDGGKTERAIPLLHRTLALLERARQGEGRRAEEIRQRLSALHIEALQPLEPLAAEVPPRGKLN